MQNNNYPGQRPSGQRTGASNPNVQRTGASNPNVQRTGAQNPNVQRSAAQSGNTARPNAQRPASSRPAGQNPGSAQRVDRSAEYARRQQAYARRQQAYEAEMARRKAIEKKRRKEKRKRAWEVFMGRAILFGIIFVILAVLAAVVFAVHFNMTHAEPEVTHIRYFHGGSEGGELEESLAVQDGVLYVDFTAAAEYLGMTQVGGVQSMRFVILRETSEDSAGDGREEEVIFYADSDLAKVNGQNVRLERKAVLNGEHYLVPASFLREYMQGVLVTQENRDVNIARTITDGVPDVLQFMLKDAGSAEPLPEDTSVGEVDPNAVIIPPVTAPPEPEVTTPPETTAPETTAPVTTTPETTAPTPPQTELSIEFKSDLSAYEKYMNPEDRDGYLVLVNAQNLVNESYKPSDLTALVDTRKDGRNTQYMAKTAAMALEAMFIELRAQGYIDVSVTSAYRSYTYQNSLFTTYTNNEMAKNPSLSRAEAEKITETYSARPGTSEHQTGLCCDMHNLGSADVAFAKQEAYKWLKDNSWKFGFIIRYPEGTQDITGISFEPWHYRFVGRYHAQAIYESGLCLEEYLEQLAKN